MAYRPIEEVEREARHGRALSRVRELGLEALVVVGVAQIAENRGNGWLSYLFGYRLEHRYGYGVLDLAGRVLLVFPEGMTWALQEMDPSLYRVPRYHARRPLGHEVAEVLREFGISDGARVGVVGLDEMLPVADYLALGDFELVDVSHQLEPIRAIKSPTEMALVEDANRIAEAGHAALMEAVAVGVSIQEIGAELYRTIFRAGALDHIMLALHGSNGRCRPYLTAPATSDYVLRPDDVLTFSMELTNTDGYWVELARIFSLGRVDAAYAPLVDTSRRAMELFEEVATSGSTGGDVYGAIDDLVRTEGFHQGHTPGHSIGQDVLEQPRIAPYEQAPLEEGMVVAFHPHVLDESETMGAYQANVYRVGREKATPLSRLPLEVSRMGRSPE